MSYILKFNNLKSVELITKFSENLLEKAKQNPSQYADLGEALYDIKAAIENIEKKYDKAAPIKPEKSASVFKYNLCEEHPDYSAKSPPRIDCEGHWNAYKKMNPNKYKQARDKYDRSKRSNKN